MAAISIADPSFVPLSVISSLPPPPLFNALCNPGLVDVIHRFEVSQKCKNEKMALVEKCKNVPKSVTINVLVSLVTQDKKCPAKQICDVLPHLTILLDLTSP